MREAASGSRARGGRREARGNTVCVGVGRARCSAGTHFETASDEKIAAKMSVRVIGIVSSDQAKRLTRGGRRTDYS